MHKSIKINMKKNTFIVLIVITFIGTYSMSHFLPLSAVLNKFRNSNETFLTNKYKSRLSVHNMLKVDSTDVVFLGNSITENFEWGEYFVNNKIKNRGIGSDVIKGVIHRLNTVGSPEKLFVMIGINDINKGHDLTHMVNDYKELMKKIINENSPRKTYFISVLPTEGQLSKLNNQILNVNKALKELTSEFGIDFIDIHSLMLSSEGKLKKEYSVDGVHLSGEGYSVMCRELRKYLN